MKLPLFILGALSAAVVHAQSAALAPATASAPTPLLGQTTAAQPAHPELPTIWLIGDSTVRNGTGYGGASGQWGWGAPFEYFFDLSKVNVINRALGGTSSRTFYNNNWPRVADSLKKGDVLFIQFGHNDKNGDLAGANASIGSLNGAGDETKEVDNTRTGAKETVHTFGWYLKQMVEQARAKGATPVICSLIPRKIWDGAKIIRHNDNYFDYTNMAAEVAKSENIAFINLNEITALKYDLLGEKKVEPMFVPTPSEHTHTDWYGAIINAESVIGGLKALKENPVAAFFSPRAAAIPAFDLAKPTLAGTSTEESATAAATTHPAAPAPAASAATAAAK